MEMARTSHICLLILTAIALMGALIYTRPVLIPFVFAVFLYAVSSPAVEWFQARCKMPRWAAVLITLLFTCLGFSLLLFLVVSSIDSFLKSAEVYRDRVVQFAQWGSALAEKFGVSLDMAAIRSELYNLPIFGWVKGLTGGAARFLGNAALVFIFFLFMILGGSGTKHPLFREIHSKISRYVGTKCFTSGLTGLLVGILLYSCGVELAVMFGVLTFLFNFIPSIGSILATALPLPVILLQFGLGWQFTVVLVISFVVQFGIGNVLEPKMMGESLDLHPVAILVFLMFWGMVWGVAGMFLAVPITAILKIILGRIPATVPVSEALAGRFPS